MCTAPEIDLSAVVSSAALRPSRGIGRCARVAALCGALFVACDAHALFVVNQPWVRPGTRNSEAYMVLTSTEGATLVGVRSSIAARVSLRGAGRQGAARAALPLPAGAAIALRPGADRIALTGLKRALRRGERVVLTLEIETATGSREEIAVDAEVRTESPFDAERQAHHH